MSLLQFQCKLNILNCLFLKRKHRHRSVNMKLHVYIIEKIISACYANPAHGCIFRNTWLWEIINIGCTYTVDLHYMSICLQHCFDINIYWIYIFKRSYWNYELYVITYITCNMQCLIFHMNCYSHWQIA